jgi:hypothetical protein
MDSNIFFYEFAYEKWPNMHFDDSDAIELYNGSIFNMRNEYNNVFEQFGTNEELNEKIHERILKLHKIKYSLNLIPSISEGQDSLMNALGETEEIQILSCKVIRDLLEFRW